MDLTATYTYTEAGATRPTVVTPKIRTWVKDGVTRTSVYGLAPLLADRIDAIENEGDRLHTLTVLSGAVIVITDQADEETEKGSHAYDFSDHGSLSTNYSGTRHLSVTTVLDLAGELRDVLAKEN